MVLLPILKVRATVKMVGTLVANLEKRNSLYGGSPRAVFVFLWFRSFFIVFFREMALPPSYAP
jgi:hypothetical protein